MIVIGVRSSWPASLMNAFWLANAVLEPVEHRVERSRQLGELVVALHRDAAGEVALGDRARRVAQHPQRRSTRPATTHASSEASSRTPTATPAATRMRVVTSSSSPRRSIATTNTPRARPPSSTGTAR